MSKQIENLYQDVLSLFRAHKSDTEEYKSKLEQLIELCKNKPEFIRMYQDSKFRLAKFYQRKHKFNISESLFLELIEQTENTGMQLSCMNELAYDFRINKQFDKAIFWYQEILKRSKPNNYDTTVLEDLAKCYGLKGDYQKERELIECQKQYYPSKDKVIELCQNASKLEAKLSNTEDKIAKNRISDQILELSKYINDLFYLWTRTDMKIAESFFCEKNYQACREHIWQILDFLKHRISDAQDYVITNAQMLLGKSYFEEGDFIKAREFFEPIANTPKEHKYFKYKRKDIMDAKNFLKKMQGTD